MGSSPDELTRFYGQPVSWISADACGSSGPSVGVWEDATAWFDADRELYRLQVGSGSEVSIGGVRAGKLPYRRCVSALEREFPDSIRGPRSFVVPEVGVKLAAPGRWAPFSPPECISICSPRSFEIEIEGLRLLAGKHLDPSRDRRARICWFIRNIPWSVSHPPLSDSRVVERAMDKGDWRKAMVTFLLSLEDEGVALPEQEYGLVVSLGQEIGIDPGLLEQVEVRPHRGTREAEDV